MLLLRPALYSLPLVALVALVAIPPWGAADDETAGTRARRPTSVATPASVAAPAFATELARLDARIRAEEERASALPSSWLARERVAQGYLERARLTGDLDDYRRATASIDEAFRIAPPGSGPFFTRARLAYSLHRLDDAERDLAHVERRLLLSTDARAGIAGLRGAIALYRGDYVAARELLVASDTTRPSQTSKSRLALLFWRTGDLDAADNLYAAASRLRVGERPVDEAWTHLMRGLLDLDRGRLDEAAAHYRDAARGLPGWWLVDEHAAEVLAERGDLTAARAAYEDVVERTHNPELMDALAEVCRRQRDDNCARRWHAAARDEHERRLAVLPEAAVGHALDHFLASADDAEGVARALELAERNHALRPDGESTTLLAAARLKAGDVPGAEALIARVETSPYRSPTLVDTAAAVRAHRQQRR